MHKSVVKETYFRKPFYHKTFNILIIFHGTHIHIGNSAGEAF